MKYALKTKTNKYIHSNSRLCGSWLDISYTHNIDEARLIDEKTVRRYKTIINSKIGEQAKNVDRSLEEGYWCTVESVEIIGIEFQEIPL